MQQRFKLAPVKITVLRSSRTACALILTASITACGGSFFVANSTVVSISLSPSSPTVQVGSTEQFVATGTRADGNTEDVSNAATWTSSKPTVATVSSSGLLSALSTGSTTITASYERGSGQAFVLVSSGTLTALTLSPTNTSIAVGGTSQYTATGTFSDGTTRNLTTTVTWSSSNTTVATITSTGLATGLKAGSTTIAAVSGSIPAQTTLTVLN